MRNTHVQCIKEEEGNKYDQTPTQGQPSGGQ